MQSKETENQQRLNGVKRRAFEQRALSHIANVIEQDRLGRIKRSILVRLDQEVSMAELEVVLGGFSPNRPAQGAQATATQTIAGIWKVQADGYVITILKEGNKSILARTYSDGDETRDPVHERLTLLGTRYDFSEGSDTGDHFVILKNGNLEARDDLGQIFVVRPLQN